MNIRCMFGVHDWVDFSKNSEKCKRCAREQPHTWERRTISLPSGSPGLHRCKSCGRTGWPLEVWKDCYCPDCQRFRGYDIGTLVSTISTKNGSYYRKHKGTYNGVFLDYEFTENPNEAPLALAVLTERLREAAGDLGEHDLERVTSLTSVTIHVQGPCNEPCRAKDLDCSTAIQLARQALLSRR
jgi:hypothetical protein